MQILRCAFEGDITVDGKFAATLMPGTVNALPEQSRALINTARTPTDKSVWGIIQITPKFLITRGSPNNKGKEVGGVEG